MMGDGVVDLRRIRNAVEDAGYTGLIEAENLLRLLVGSANGPCARHLRRALSQRGLSRPRHKAQVRKPANTSFRSGVKKLRSEGRAMRALVAQQPPRKHLARTEPGLPE